jgi:hypothetical protein
MNVGIGKLVETEANGDSRNTKGVLSWLFRWARRAAILDFCSALAALVSPVQDSYLTAPFFTFLIPIAQQPWQSVVQGRLSLCLCSILSKQIH